LRRSYLGLSRLEAVSYSPLVNYPDDELLGLVEEVSGATAVPTPELLRRFGARLFRTLATLYPVFLDGVETALDLLGGIETYLHGEVKKLYADADFSRRPPPRILPAGPGGEALVHGPIRHLAVTGRIQERRSPWPGRCSCCGWASRRSWAR
jgi:heme-NO-binding protein